MTVFHANPQKPDRFNEVEEILKENNCLVGDFVVTYISCRLRLELAKHDLESLDYRLPLATRSLLTFSTTSDEVSDNPAEEDPPGIILPPLLHHPVYFSTIDLNRPDIGHVMGCGLALQLREGLHILRSVMGLRSSFIVWFIDDRKPFDLSLAIHRDNGISITSSPLLHHRLL